MISKTVGKHCELWSLPTVSFFKELKLIIRCERILYRVLSKLVSHWILSPDYVFIELTYEKNKT